MSTRPMRPESGQLRPLSASRSRRSLTKPDDESQDPERWRRLSGSGQHFQDDDDEHLLLHQTVLASKKQQLEHQHERLAKQRAFIRHERRKLLLQNALLESERERFQASLASDWFCTAAFPSSSTRNGGRRVALDVGGQLFEISYAVATKDPGSLLAALVDDNDSPLAAHERGCFRVDRDWWIFRYVLRFLRDGILPSEPKLLRELYLESEFWRFESLRKAIEARNMELLQRREENVPASSFIDKEAIRRGESSLPKTSPPRDPSAWWQEPPIWWGAPKQEPAKKAEAQAASAVPKEKDKEEPDAWWKTSTYKGTDYWHLLSTPSARKPSRVDSSGANREDRRYEDDGGRSRPNTSASGTPRTPLIVHSTWPSLTHINS